MQIEARGLVYDASTQPAERRVACFTSMCATSAGSILVGYHVGPAKHAPTSTTGLSRSRDGGQTWQAVPIRLETVLNGVPGSVAGGEIVEAEPGRLLLFTTWFDRSDPSRPLFDPVTEGVLPSKQLVAESTDDGVSWGPWRVLATPGLTGTALTGPVLKWSDGTIAFPFESYKEWGDTSPGRHGAWALVSRDAGKTFGPPQLIAQHPAHKHFYWDQRLCVGQKPGEYDALFWTHDLEHKKDLTVHFRHASVGTTDFRAHPILDTQIPGQIAAPLRLDDGRLLGFVVDRGSPRAMNLWVSRDDGKTWPEQDRLVVYNHDEQARLSQGADNIDFKQYWEDMGKWTFGHPAIRPLADGRVLLAWYAGTPGCLSIHWARIEC